MITDSDLCKLASFGKEKDGEYCDRWEFSICPMNKDRTKWILMNFCEVYGTSDSTIKVLEDMDDLKFVGHMRKMRIMI